MRLPLGQSAYKRVYGREPEIVLKNRFFEQSPTNQEAQVALLSRPPTSLLVQLGSGPIRANFSQPGLFSGDLFSVSDTTLYRYDGTTGLAIEGTITSTASAPRFAASNVGGVQRLFICDGLLLQYFQGPAYQATLTYTPGTIADDKIVIDGVTYQFSSDFSAADKAVGTLTLTPGAIADDKVQIGTIYYQFSAGSVDAGTPLGTLANPYLVNKGASDTAAFANLRKAINLTGAAGTDYSTATVIHPLVESTASNATTLSARAKSAGTAGNAIATTVTPTGGADGLAWGAATLTGGFNTDGSDTHPWFVAVGMTAAISISNLRKAINASGVAGTDYIAGLVENPRVFSNANDSTTLTARSRFGGAPDPAVAVSVSAVSTADGFAWSSGTLVAGPQALYGVETPDGVAIVAIDVIDGYILCLAGASQRVYFIKPGEITIDPLDFIEAESEPDRVNDIVVVGDNAWLIGQSSTDIYYPTGVSASPFARAQGRPFPIGGIQGTCIKIAASLLIAGVDNTVYLVADGPTPVSTNGIAERLRLAREAERDNP